MSRIWDKHYRDGPEKRGKRSSSTLNSYAVKPSALPMSGRASTSWACAALLPPTFKFAAAAPHIRLMIEPTPRVGVLAFASGGRPGGAGPLDGASRGCDTEHSELVEDEPADVPARMRTPPAGNPLCAASVGIVTLAGTRAGSRR